jgi:hypothetical protein
MTACEPKFEVFVRVSETWSEKRQARPESASRTSPGQVEHVPRSSQPTSHHVPHFVFAISHLLSHLSSATGHGYVPGYITKVVIDGTAYLQLNMMPSDSPIQSDIVGKSMVASDRN